MSISSSKDTKTAREVCVFPVPDVPQTKVVWDNASKASQGGFLNFLREYFKKLIEQDFDENTIEAILAGVPLLDAYAGVGVGTTLPESFHADILKALNSLLQFQQLDHETLEAILKATKDQLLSNWIAFEQSKAGEEFFKVPGREGYRSGFKPGSKARGGKAQPKGAPTRKAGAGAEDHKEREEVDVDDSFDGAPGIMFGEGSDEDSPTTRTPKVGFARSLKVLTNGDNIGAALLKIPENNLLVASVEATDKALLAHVQWLSQTNSEIKLAADAVGKMTPKQYNDNPLVSSLEKKFGVQPKWRLILSIVLQSFALAAAKPKRVREAQKAFDAYGNDAAPRDVPGSKAKFNEAVKRLEAEGGKKPEDDGALAEAYLASLSQSSVPFWRETAAAVQIRLDDGQADEAIRALRAAAGGGGFPAESTPAVVTLDLMVGYADVECKVFLKKEQEKVKAKVQGAAASTTPATAKLDKPKLKSKKPTNTATDEDEDGPSHLANAAHPAPPARDQSCWICKGDHRMNAKKTDGSRFHSNQEIDAFKMAQRAAQGLPAAPADHAGGNGKGKGKGTGKGAAGTVNNQVQSPGIVGGKGARGQLPGKGGKGGYGSAYGKGGRGYGHSGGAVQQEAYWGYDGYGYGYAGGATHLDALAQADLAVIESQAALKRAEAFQRAVARQQGHGGEESDGCE